MNEDDKNNAPKNSGDEPEKMNNEGAKDEPKKEDKSEKVENESSKDHAEDKSSENNSAENNHPEEKPAMQSMVKGPQIVGAGNINCPTPNQTMSQTSNQAQNQTQNHSQNQPQTPGRNQAPNAAQRNQKSGSGNTAAIIVAIVALVCSIVSVSLFAALYQRNQGEITFYGSGTDGNSTNFTDGSIADVASKVAPSVVSIITETRTSSWYGSYSANSAGTGFIVSEDGYIVTNKHVVDGARAVNVILDDGTQYEKVTIVGTDPLNDVAILKLENGTNLKPITLGDSKTIHIGEQVIAVGNALGAYQNTVTYGIISGTGRSLTASDSSGKSYEQLSDMIQTDAAINGGNSGGPLVNAAGEVIGINTAYASDSQSIGFAIPISGIKGLIRDVQKTGKVQRAVLGVRYVNLTPAVAKEYNLDINYGAYVTAEGSENAVISGGAAEKAGVKTGDIITAINGTKIGSSGSLSTIIGEYSIGDTVQLTIHRGGQDYTATVTLAPYKE